MAPKKPFVLCENLMKIFTVEDLEVLALQGLNLEVQQGELMAIVGASGSGKSTLLNVLGGLDVPTAGTVQVGDWHLTKMNSRDRIRYRREMVGFVWQHPGRNLVPYLTALGNIELPMVLAGRPDKRRAKQLLAAVGLKKRMHHRPYDLSGGEQQRIAIAVALANAPRLVLADEPTGALDSKTSATMLDLLHRMREAFGVTVIIVTHDPAVAQAADRYVEIRDGKLSTEVVRHTATTAAFSHLLDPLKLPAVPPGEGIETAESLPLNKKVDAPEAAGMPTDERTHETFTLLDAAGRVQLPKQFTNQLTKGRRVKMILEEERVIIQRPDPPR